MSLMPPKSSGLEAHVRRWLQRIFFKIATLGLVSLLVFALTPATAWAAGLPGSSIGNESGVAVEALGMSCFAFDQPSDILPCNPGFIAQERPSVFRAQAFLGNNVSYLKDVSDLVNGTASPATIHDLFSRQETSELTTSLNAGYLATSWGVEVTPLRLSYVTLFQNQALPQVQLFASLEESARVQFGSYIGDDLFWGAQIRYLHRRFIATDFFLTDILVEDGAHLLTPQDQNSIYLEPSLVYAPQTDLNPTASISVMNFGVTDRGIDGLPLFPQYHFDLGIAPKRPWGDLSLGLDMLLDSNSVNSQSALTLGASYRYGILKVMGSLARNANGFGFAVSDDIWSLGLSYANQTLQDELGQQYNDRKIYLMVGIQF